MQFDDLHGFEPRSGQLGEPHQKDGADGEVRGHDARVDVEVGRIDPTDLDAGRGGRLGIVAAQGQGQDVLEPGQPIAAAAEALD